MKKLFLLLLLTPMFAAAQTTAIPATDPTDTIKIKRLKSNKPEESNGIKMGTAYDIWENTSQTPQLTSLSKAIRAAGLISTFRSNGPITLFAPNNEAFKKMPKKMMDSLMKRSRVLELSTFLTCHAVPGSLSSKDLAKLIDDKTGNAKLITLGGNVLLVSKGEGDNLVLKDEKGNKCNIIAPDLGQRNGYIHVINAVLIPKPKVL